VTIPPPASPIAGLPDATLAAIAAAGTVRTYPGNTVLIREGEVGDSLFILLSGRVKVYASNEDGREVVIDFHGAGEYVGEMSLDGAPRSASVITVLPTTCAIVDRAQFRDFALALPQGEVRVVSEKLTHAEIAARVGASRDMVGRLLKDLVAGGYVTIEDCAITLRRKLPLGW
jgi:CRP/FNR family cyclic AMP-dependent transcriptional regulator